MPMSDSELLGQAPVPLDSPAPAPAAPSSAAPALPPPLPQTTDADLIARAAVAEGDQNNPESWQNIAGVILNRARISGRSVADVLTEPGQFEAYGNGHIQSVDPNSPAYKAAYQAIQPVISGAVKIPPDRTSFYQPDIVAQRGVKPPFDPSTGVKIGTQLFGSGYQAPQDFALSADDQKLWDNLYGGAKVQIEPGKGLGGSGAATNQVSAPEQAAYKFLTLHNLVNAQAEKGTRANPTGLPAGATDAQMPDGVWYVNHQGQLRVGGDASGTDYLPEYMAAAKRQTQVAMEPAYQRFGEDVAQAVPIVAGSINRLAGGISPTPGVYLSGNDPLAPGNYGPSQAQQARDSVAYFATQRNAFNMAHALDPLRVPGQVVGETALTVPMVLAGQEGLELAGAGLARAAPEAAPTVDFLAGRAAGNPLLAGASKGVARAGQGAAYSALTSNSSDRPVGEQMATGAVLNPLLGAGGDVLGNTADRILGGAGNQTVSAPVADLADQAVSRYKIPLRRGQVLAADGDRAAAYKDNLLLAQSPKFQANDQGQDEAFTRAVSNTFGEDSPSLTPGVMQKAKTRIGQVFNYVASRTAIGGPNDPIGPLRVTALATTLDGVGAEAGRVLPDSEMKPLMGQIADIKSAINNGQLSGESYQALIRKGGPLDRLQNSNDPNISHYAGQIRDALDDALEHAAAPEDLSALQTARQQYKALQTVAPLVRDENVSGLVSPAKLNGAVNRSYANRAFQGAGDLGDLAKIGQTFLKEPPQSGTEPRLQARQFVNGFRLPLSFGLGGEFASGVMHDPFLALKGAAIGAGIEGLKKLRQGMLENTWGPKGANALIQASKGGGVPVPTPQSLPGAIFRNSAPPVNLLLQQAPAPQPS